MRLTLTPFLAAPLLLAATASGWCQQSPDPQQVTRLVVELANEFRAQESRGRVGGSNQLAAAARDFAEYLARTGEFSHEAGGTTPPGRAKRHGYDYCVLSENIAYQYSSAGFATRDLAQRFVEGWKNSPGHRRNMLDPDVTQTGVAVARGKPGHYYAVQMFGRPVSEGCRKRLR